jgi:hypothetical protein
MKLQHQQPDGTIATRSTERAYQFVAVAEGEVATWHTTRELADKQIAAWKSKDASLRAKGYDLPFYAYTVEEINNGNRN